MLPQQYCLRWRYHHSNLQTMFSQLLEREAFCDVVLACEGKTIKAHKIVLSACSTYFDTILSQFEDKDPILIMKDVKYSDIKCLIEFMYKGEINVDHNHLATLLKTAEELRIKGLAEVSWREQTDPENGSGCGGGGGGGPTNGVQTVLPHVSAVMDESRTGGAEPPPAKRKRGRPPLDAGDHEANVATTRGNGGGEDGYSDAMSSSEHDLSIWEEENVGEDGADGDAMVKVKTELKSDDEESGSEHLDRIPSMVARNSFASNAQLGTGAKGGALTGAGGVPPSLEKEWSDVIKMNDYLSTGRRQQFWEEPFTKRVMDAIKNKNLEMKIAAELLGVSYGTLYGRYRDAYGCLKHPYRIPNLSPAARIPFWSEQGPTDILLKLKRKEITLFRAAEQLNVTAQTLSNYLISMSALDSEATQNNNAAAALGGAIPFAASDGAESEDSEAHAAANSAVLANCPDITIIKREKAGATGAADAQQQHRVNNNSSNEHSENPSSAK